MTLQELIANYNQERENQISDDQKIRWIKNLELTILNDIYLFYDDQQELLEDFGLTSELLVPEPYSDLYTYYLDERIAWINGDAARYNKAREQYNNTLVSFQQYYNRTSRPTRAPKRTFNHSWLN